MSFAKISTICCLVLLVLSSLSIYYISTTVSGFFSDPLGSITGAIFSDTGVLADCPDGYTNMGLTCYRGPSTKSNGSSVANCPSGYTNMGASCYMGPSTYTKGCTTIFKKYSCRSGYTDNGCFCGKGASSLSMSSMTCPADQDRIGGRCYKKCPEGYTNNGEFCGRGASTLEMSAMTCKEGFEKKGAVGRCFKKKEWWQFW